MALVAIVAGIFIVGLVVADLVHTLVTTTRSRGRWWPTQVLYLLSWSLVRSLGRRIDDDRRKKVFYGTFAPLSVIGMLITWVSLQIVGFGLIWWGIGDIEGAESLFDATYYSGVVYLTLGFGEIVPDAALPRLGALVEAFSGVLTTALVIGYLPALYAAYSEREQQLLMLDDGSEERITPTNLVLSRCIGGDIRGLDDFFTQWEAWTAQVMETHTTFRMLVLFRSQHPGQNWVTGLGLVMDAALHAQLMAGCHTGPSYWLIRRGTRLLQLLTEGADLTEKQAEFDATFADDDVERFRLLYDRLDAAGFPMLGFDEARSRSLTLRRAYAPQLEFMIDALDAPRGFWGHRIGNPLAAPTTDPSLTAGTT